MRDELQKFFSQIPKTLLIRNCQGNIQSNRRLCRTATQPLIVLNWRPLEVATHSGHSVVSLVTYLVSEIEDYEMKSTNWKDIPEDGESIDVSLPR